jgi:hypothetical protein
MALRGISRSFLCFVIRDRKSRSAFFALSFTDGNIPAHKAFSPLEISPVTMIEPSRRTDRKGTE